VDLVRSPEVAHAAAVVTKPLRRYLRELFTHRGLHFVLLSVLGMVLSGSALELLFEAGNRDSNIHSYGGALWWAMVTITTVGYGDKYPVTLGGRAIAVVMMLVGIGLIGVLTATVASYFVGEKANQDQAALHQRLDRIEMLLASMTGASAQPDGGGSATTSPTPQP